MPALGSPGDIDPRGLELPEFSLPLWWDAASDGAGAEASAAVDLGKTPPPAAWDEPPVGAATFPSAGTPGAAAEKPVVSPGTPTPETAYTPAAEPEAALGWDFEQPENGPFVWEDAPRRRPLWLPVGIGVLFLALAVVAALILTREDKKPEPPPPAPAPPAVATPISPEKLAEYQPQQVVALPFEGRLQVTWEAPLTTDGIYGYMVIAQTPAGEQVSPAPVLVKSNERFTVFTGQAAVPGTCVVVTTLVSGQPSMSLAKGDAVCPGAAPEASADGSSENPQGAAPGTPQAVAVPDSP
ncbi:hypothetical protein LO772_22425 [Yinghuangia sp. ASG 101]|uniref:hypothetical protein n=1 Tax=Yinghuangia sp. ASG 101 TaxID=2896848 RepID=UPI001E2AE450|nr:hypothetical protein [Yinghuangia sp. ASG 101]UGQ09662.1 hypothetical protein LO772_22425 [Yinghuangia sp. ASG 101]